MPNYDDDFEVQPKFKDGVKQKGKGGGSKKNNIQRKKGSNSNKEIYNSKHIRVQNEKIEKCKSRRINIESTNEKDKSK